MILRRAAVSTLAAVAMVTALSACGSDDNAAPAATNAATTQTVDVTTDTATDTAATVVAQAKLVDPSGAEKGTVTFTEAAGGLDVAVEASDLSPGFHGLHVHAVGKCEPNSPDPADASKTGNFLSSGGHLAGQEGAGHPDHVGDLPMLQVGANGEAKLDAHTDRLTKELLLDSDGSSVIVHESDDNYANIPTRYAAGGADDETKKAGDAGARALCGVVEAP